MKVILLGNTGFIGKEVLARCLKTPAITSIIALSRRELPRDTANQKLTTVIIEDFKVYPDSVLEKLKDADGCVWSMGTYNWDPVVELEYPEAFQKALLKVLDVNKTFAYAYLGGAFTEPDQEKTLWFYSEGRRVRGLAQTKFLEFGRQNQNVKAYVVRPSGVLPGDGNAVLGYLLGTVSVRRLAAVMVDLIVNGGSEQILVNKVIVKRGRELLVEQE